jgi:septum formation protein
MDLLGVEFRVHGADVDETLCERELPIDYVLRVALAKAKAVERESKPNTKILTADTSVCIDGEIFGKPEGKDHAFETYQRLSGRWHDVHTGIAFIGLEGKTEAFVVISQVEMVCMNRAV